MNLIQGCVVKMKIWITRGRLSGKPLNSSIYLPPWKWGMAGPPDSTVFMDQFFSTLLVILVPWAIWIHLLFLAGPPGYISWQYPSSLHVMSRIAPLVPTASGSWLSFNQETPISSCYQTSISENVHWEVSKSSCQLWAWIFQNRYFKRTGETVIQEVWFVKSFTATSWKNYCWHSFTHMQMCATTYIKRRRWTHQNFEVNMGYMVRLYHNKYKENSYYRQQSHR